MFHIGLLASYSERFVMSAFLKEDLHLLIWATYYVMYHLENTKHACASSGFLLHSLCKLLHKCCIKKFMLVIVIGAVPLKYKQFIFYMLASNFMLLSCSKITKACLLNLINITAEYELEVIFRPQMALLLQESIYF